MTDMMLKEQEIEVLRKQLATKVAEKEGNLKHPEVVALSAQLDELIVEWQKARW